VRFRLRHLEIVAPQFKENRTTLISFYPKGKIEDIEIGVVSRKKPAGCFQWQYQKEKRNFLMWKYL